jgi:hypothetical protein
MLKRHLLSRGLARTVVEARTTDAEQFRLGAQRYIGCLTFDERHALLPREGRDQIAF